MHVFDHPEFDHHESIHFFEEPDAGLRAVIAIHSTMLGPAAGGCRRWQYANDIEALTDVLRLSRGMTYKNAVAGLPFGGGKAVILADGIGPARADVFAAFGRKVDALTGRYITAEDVGVSVEDMQEVRKHTRYVSGLPQNNGVGGDPSPWTARGVFLGIQAAADVRLGRDSLKDLTVAVQGVGHVGFQLCRLLHAAGANLVVADVNRESLKRLSDELPVSQTSPTELIFSEADILAPCALGNILNSETIPRIRTKVIAGAANNQLATETDGARLAERGILYAPDYVINAGGIISVAREYLGHSSEGEVRSEVDRIPERLRDIFLNAEHSGKATNVVADELARQIVADGKIVKNAQASATGRRIA